VEARKNLSLARSIVQGTRSKTTSLFAEISDDLMRKANASNASRRIAKARRVLLSIVNRPLPSCDLQQSSKLHTCWHTRVSDVSDPGRY
jgi:hypothetical protein